jgi:copper chaperone CopZ
MTESNLQQDRTIETKVIAISGMTCDHCARRVEKALKGENGVHDVLVDRHASRATVTFDGRQTDIPALHEAIRKAGYGVAPGG